MYANNATAPWIHDKDVGIKGSCLIVSRRQTDDTHLWREGSDGVYESVVYLGGLVITDESVT